MSLSLVQVCESWHLGSDSEYVCDSFVLKEAVLLPASATDQLDLLLQGGFSVEAAELGFSAVLSLWAIGVTVGIIIAQIRKLRV